MTLELEQSADGTVVQTPSYRLVFPAGERRHVRLEVPPGRPIGDLVLLSSAHSPLGVDELTRVGEIVARRSPDGAIDVVQEAASTVWEHKEARLSCRPESLVYQARFRGTAALDEVHLFESGDRDARYLNRPTLSGFWRPPRAREGWAASRAHFPRVFSPAPNGAARTHFWHGERATNHPGHEAEPWGGDWIFTPAPFAYGLGGDGRWLMVGLAPPSAGAAPDWLSFVHFDYRGGEGWGLALTYGGEVRAEGVWASPRVVLLAAGDEYVGLAAYRDWLAADGGLPEGEGSEAWWREPIWCGWGEQVAREDPSPEGRRAKDLSTQANYERWLGVLERHGLSPGTVVIDDRWQARLGAWEPSRRWPRLQELVAAQHAAGRRVLLWHNAWEVEVPEAGEGLVSLGGVPALGAFGYPMRDPTAPGFGDRLRHLMARLLGPPPHGLGADGLKIDITHSTPLRPGYGLAGSARGNALLYGLLRETYRAAKEVRPDAMIESHAANPFYRDTCDVLRLNDVFSDLASVVPQMRHRARVARAAGFDLLDTDGWQMPSRAALLEYAEAQPELGIPALYYATRVDRTGELLRPEDYRRIATAWARYRRDRRD